MSPRLQPYEPEAVNPVSLRLPPYEPEAVTL